MSTNNPKDPHSRPRRRYSKARQDTRRFMCGSYANPDNETKAEMHELGDDLGLLARLERDLTRAWKPQNSMQALIVADLAKLYWKKTHLERTVVANRTGERQRVTDAIQLHNFDENSDDDPLDPADVETEGFRGITDSGEAYEESMALLNRLHKLVLDRDWTADVESITNLLYGERRPPRCREILDHFTILANREDEFSEEDEKAACAKLTNLVMLEKASVLRAQTLFRKRRLEEFRGTLGSVWVPTTENWDLVMAQEAHLDRMIESKTKLLIRLQGLSLAQRAKRNGKAPEVEESEWRTPAEPARVEAGGHPPPGEGRVALAEGAGQPPVAEDPLAAAQGNDQPPAVPHPAAQGEGVEQSAASQGRAASAEGTAQHVSVETPVVPREFAAEPLTDEALPPPSEGTGQPARVDGGEAEESENAEKMLNEKLAVDVV